MCEVREGSRRRVSPRNSLYGASDAGTKYAHCTGSCAPPKGRLKPIFFTRAINVDAFTPKSSAAPSMPFIFQPVFRRIARRFSRSWRRISDSVRYSASGSSSSCGPKEVRSTKDSVTGRSNSGAPPPAMMTARSMTLRSSLFSNPDWWPR